MTPYLANRKAADLTIQRTLARQLGSHRHRWRGIGTTFESLRDYSPQDDVRWVDWKATARRQRPISRNYEMERLQHVLVVLDASRTMATHCQLASLQVDRAWLTKLDVAIEAALLLIRAASQVGDAVGLMVFSDRVDAYLAPRRVAGQAQRAMELLYDRQPRPVEPGYESALLLVGQRLRRRSLLVLFTDVTQMESARELARFMTPLARRHVPLVVTIADDMLEQLELQSPETVWDLYRVGVAHELLHARELVLTQLKHVGVDIVDAPASQLAVRSIERYLELKRRLRV